MHPNFDATKFVTSRDTIYITAPSHKQQLSAPIIVGLLQDIRKAAFELGRRAPAGISDHPPVIWMLDEVANIAPLADLPEMLSEAGGQGLQIVACLQDMAQARKRWGRENGIMSKCRTKLIFPGISEQEDLEQLSTVLGDWDRKYTSISNTTGRFSSQGVSAGMGFGTSFSGGGGGSSGGFNSSRHFSENASFGENRSETRSDNWTREHLLSPSEISRIQNGCALFVHNTTWAVIRVLPHHSSQVWQSIKDASIHLRPSGSPDELAFAPVVTVPMGEAVGKAST
jgi:type IV secretory pathway TraG/TraD family ATPase VirD4